jgi:two-component system LytT family response regulator
MKRIKVIVVEDERLPRLSLLAKLENYREELDIVDACDSYDSAYESILRHRPDLLFLDIQLQGRDAIQLLEELRTSISLPYVIFTTAYSAREYLMSAIKLQAVDYLLKPIGREDLAQALAKVRDRIQDTARHPEVPEKMVFKSVNSLLFLSAEEIAAFKAEGNYTTLITFNEEALVLESLLSLEKRLDPLRFVRVDRSTIVNVRMVCRLNPQERSCTLQSSDGRSLTLNLSKNGTEALLSVIR